MSDELKQLEVELAKVRLAKEQLELQEAVQRAQRKQRLADGTDKLIDAGRSAAQGSVAALTQRALTTPITWAKIGTYSFFAIVFFVTYVDGLPDSKNNPMVAAFFGSIAIGLYAAFLLFKKLLQLAFLKG